MEGGSLFNPGVLGIDFLWWIGQIADDSTWRDNIMTGKFKDKDTKKSKKIKDKKLGLTTFTKK